MTEMIGRFHIRKRLGGGGFGEVFLGEDATIGREVAIKIFRPKDENLIAFATSSAEEGLQILRDRFLGEAKILASLENSVNVVNVLEYGELPDGAPYYVMPYLPHSLADELGKDVFDVRALEELPVELHPQSLPMERSLKILEQLLHGLAAAHARGLIHRDIKPGNIMLTTDDDVRVVDFGIAKAPDSQHSTVSHLGLGSRNYMAPEQRESAKHVDARADIYSVGRVAYRMLTGKLPVGRYADPDVAVPALGKTMNAVLLSALAEDRESRPDNATQMLERFTAARPTVGKADDSQSDSRTWFGQGEGDAGIRDDLKPLKQRIISLMNEAGYIAGTDREGLLAMAAIADLDESGLDALIAEVLRNDKALAAKQRLADMLRERVLRQGGPLAPATLAAYESAAQAVDWDSAKLQVIMQQAVDELPPSAHAHAAADEPAAKTSPETTKPSLFAGFTAGRMAAALAFILLLVGGIGGFQYWQKMEDAKTAGVEQGQALQAQAISEQSDQTRIRNVQDYLNRLGYRVAENGEADTRTTEAIRAFELKQGMISTGAPDEMLAKALIEEYGRRHDAAWEQATKDDTEASYQQYREAWPQGANIGELDERIASAISRQAEQARNAAENRKKQEAAQRLKAQQDEQNRQAEQARQAALAAEQQERENQQKVAQKARDLQQCMAVCSRKSESCVRENNPGDCSLEQCSTSNPYATGNAAMLELGSFLGCKQDAKREYESCKRDANEEQQQCEVKEGYCDQDCQYKHG